MKSSMTAPIPEDVQNELSESPRMKICCVANEKCAGRIEWHHAMTFQSRRIQKAFAIVGICAYHHLHEAGCADRILRVCLNLATDEELEEISKAIDYKAMRDRLNLQYAKN
jgi:hypothetical protein